MNAPVRIPVVLSDDQYEDMARKGAFARVGRVELRGGVVVAMSPVHFGHSSALKALFKAMDAALPPDGDLEANFEISIRFGCGFQPTADLAVWSRAALDAGHDGPLPAGAVRLVVEVADASLSDDLGQKMQDYAQAGLAEYWVVDVRARVIHQFVEPIEGGYRHHRVAAFGACVNAATSGIAIDTARF